MLHEALDAPLERRAREQHLAVAGQAADADLGAEAHYAPGVAAAGVRFAHLDDITEVDVKWRSGHVRLLL